jgi:hypothetical protein
MIEVLAKKTILLRQDKVAGKTKDTYTKKGEKIKVSEEDAIKCWGAFDFTESQQKSLLALSKRDKLKRVI